MAQEERRRGQERESEEEKEEESEREILKKKEKKGRGDRNDISTSCSRGRASLLLLRQPAVAGTELTP